MLLLLPATTICCLTALLFDTAALRLWLSNTANAAEVATLYRNRCHLVLLLLLPDIPATANCYCCCLPPKHCYSCYLIFLPDTATAT
jgi:hypothetical protein